MRAISLTMSSIFVAFVWTKYNRLKSEDKIDLNVQCGAPECSLEASCKKTTKDIEKAAELTCYDLFPPKQPSGPNVSFVYFETNADWILIEGGR